AKVLWPGMGRASWTGSWRRAHDHNETINEEVLACASARPSCPTISPARSLAPRKDRSPASPSRSRTCTTSPASAPAAATPAWPAPQAPATANASVVQKLLDGGASIIGKTVCDEFFYSVAGVNAHYGTPVNPRAPGRIPGGSSSGSASAAAAGACDLAIGSDT